MIGIYVVLISKRFKSLIDIIQRFFHCFSSFCIFFHLIKLVDKFEQIERQKDKQLLFKQFINRVVLYL